MNMFAEGAERNKALSAWSGIGATAATVGLLAGGLLTRYASWQYIFYLNVPAGAAALLLARRVVPESRLRGARRRYEPLRRHHRNRRPRPSGLRDLAGPDRRLGIGPDAGHVGGIGGL